MILAFYKKGKLSIEDIADAAEVSLEYVKELVKNLSKGIIFFFPRYNVSKSEINKLPMSRWMTAVFWLL